MFDTMTITKAGGALCGAFLAFLLLKMAAGGLYSIAPASHGEEGRVLAYSVDTGAAADDAAAAPATEGPSFEEVFATADAAAGEKVFSKCRACHKVDGSDGTGPHLNGVYNRVVASVAGFAYSDGMKAHGGNWDLAALDAFLTSPRTATPGTKMSFAGLPNVQERANIIKYLESLGG